MGVPFWVWVDDMFGFKNLEIPKSDILPSNFSLIKIFAVFKSFWFKYS
jgi:hypothetical protein